MIESVSEHESVPVSPCGTVECMVEIPKGSRNKYEYDARLGRIKLDRFVSGSVVYSTDYGFERGNDPHVVCVAVADRCVA
jgi:inorganic pyrophosphatase